jgi:hypothetical protein
MDNNLDKLEAILEKMDNLAEKSEISPATRTILKIFQDTAIINDKKVISISLFDEFNNEALSHAMGEIRETCVRMEASYRFTFERICRIKSTTNTQRVVNFI